jgi:prepilin-type N-terminal cleavage/methylation domain-containing protein
MFPNASKTVRNAPGSGRLAPRGFSLLEILVVLLLLAVVAGLVAPKVATMYEAGQRRLNQDEALQRIGAIGFMAYNQGVELWLTQFPDPELKDFPLSLPKGWSFVAEKPIYYNYNGVCSGGTLSLRSPDRVISVTLEPPFCRARVGG